MEHYRFAGYRVIQFPEESRVALTELAERLIPHTDEIIKTWLELQFSAWQPPVMTRDEISRMFSELFRGVLQRLKAGELEACINDLEESGARLARSDFSYEALIISIHFLEQSYMPFLLNPRSERTQEWLIRMDEFLHVGLAALATSYFEFFRESLIADAEVGRIVQEALFPHLPRKIVGLDVGFIYASATETAQIGGDFLDLFQLGENKVAFVVGDLSGHGLEAAADSAAIRNLFRGFMYDVENLADAVLRLNKTLARELEEFQFATALAGTYEAPGKLTIVNAGNPLPVFSNDGTHFVEQIGLPLAVNYRGSYGQVETDLKPGEVFVSYTDGLLEARSDNGIFGEYRILQSVDEMKDAPARAIADHLKDKAIRFANGRLLDDMAILVLKRMDG